MIFQKYRNYWKFIWGNDCNQFLPAFAAYSAWVSLFIVFCVCWFGLFLGEISFRGMLISVFLYSLPFYAPHFLLFAIHEWSKG